MSDIDRIIAAARRDARTVGSGDLLALCNEIETLRAELAAANRPPVVRHGQAIDMDHPLAEGLVLECLDTSTLVNTVRRYYRMYRELRQSKEPNAGPAIQP